MDTRGHIAVIRIHKTNGLRGFLKAEWLMEPLDPARMPGHLFLPVDGRLLPYFIQDIDPSMQQELLIRFEGANDRESAAALQSKDAYLPETDASGLFAEFSPDSEAAGLVGFTAFDHELGELGMVNGYSELPGQELLIIDYGGKELLIPFASALVESIEAEKKQIRFRLPESYLDII